jgi:hypothetical protein
MASPPRPARGTVDMGAGERWIRAGIGAARGAPVPVSALAVGPIGAPEPGSCGAMGGAGARRSARSGRGSCSRRALCPAASPGPDAAERRPRRSGLLRLPRHCGGRLRALAQHALNGAPRQIQGGGAGSNGRRFDGRFSAFLGGRRHPGWELSLLRLDPRIGYSRLRRFGCRRTRQRQDRRHIAGLALNRRGGSARRRRPSRMNRGPFGGLL